MKSRKGRTPLGMIVLIVFLVTAILIGTVIALFVKGCNYVVDTVETTTSTIDATHERRLISDPPLYKVGDIVYHRASDAKLIISNPSVSWKDGDIYGWTIKVKDGGNWDRVGGKILTESDVKPSLDEPPEVEKK